MNEQVRQKQETFEDFLVKRLGQAAQGTIEAGPRQQEKLEAVTRDLQNGVFHELTDGLIPSGCIDGRDTKDGLELQPDSAGGSESLFVAKDLIGLFPKNTSTASNYQQTLEAVVAKGLPVGGHSDDHAEGLASGCGANDKLKTIYNYIAQNGEYLQSVAESIGISIDETTTKLIVKNAKRTLKITEFSPGSELRDILDSYDGDTVSVLEGAHMEVAAVINTVHGTTLNRMKLREKHGEQYQAFNVDAWSFAHAADVMVDEQDKQAYIAALTFYNLSTTHVLCGPNMRVIVR